MAQLSELPPLAIIFFGITLAFIFGVRHLGLLAGANTPAQKSGGGAEVAAVIVDPTALNNATAAVKDLTAAMKVGQEKQDDHAHMLCRRVDALSGEVENLTRNVNALVLEMARKQR